MKIDRLAAVVLVAVFATSAWFGCAAEDGTTGDDANVTDGERKTVCNVFDNQTELTVQQQDAVVEALTDCLRALEWQR